jgi:4-diphosphocytidyl-2-C-methyl-D-erythritol kinase
MGSANAFAKINLGLVVGPVRSDGKHEVVTVLQAVDLHDTVELELAPAAGFHLEGFDDDTIVRSALTSYAELTGAEPGWRVRIVKRIPVAAGLGGGSSDAAAALRLANELAESPLGQQELRAVAARVGSDVPFFLEDGAQLATEDGSELEPLALPLDYWVVLVLHPGERKESTAAVYERFDDRAGAVGFDARREAFLDSCRRVERATDLALLPRNDLASSALAAELEDRGAFRADVSGAGPAVYGLFESRTAAETAWQELGAESATWLVAPIG